MEFRRVLFRSAGFIVDQAQQLAQHHKPDMADGAVLAVVAVAPKGKPLQPVIFLGRMHEARDILGLERLPESTYPALLRAAVAIDPLPVIGRASCRVRVCQYV